MEDIVEKVKELLESGMSQRAVANAIGVSKSTVSNYALGCNTRQTKELTEVEREYICRIYLSSNRSANAGSLLLACRLAADALDSPLRAFVKIDIFKYAKWRNVPSYIRKACYLAEKNFEYMRAGRDSVIKSGVCMPGKLRVDKDTGLVFAPGKRQIWDDASVNVGVVVPWQKCGDPCADKWGCRVARFQLLLGIDAGTDFCVGYHYVMRDNDAYNAADVVSAFDKTWRLAGGHPAEVVLEGGSWQAKRTLDYLEACGVSTVSAKGRPNQKLVEGYFNRLWTVLSCHLPARGQVGRFRGEMQLEKGEWDRARRGVIDPRKAFPTLEEFLSALDKSIAFLNSKQINSKIYGSWVPKARYEAVQLLAMPGGLERYAMPITAVRKVTRGGIVSVSAECVYGYSHQFTFAISEGYKFDGAMVEVAFDNRNPERGAVVTLAKNFRCFRGKKVLDTAAVLISGVPSVRFSSGAYQCSWLDNTGAAMHAKKKYLHDVASVTKAFDVRSGRVAKAIGTPKADEDLPGGVLPSLPKVQELPDVPKCDETEESFDFDELEKMAGFVS